MEPRTVTSASRLGGWLLVEAVVALAMGVVVLGAATAMVLGTLGGGEVVAARAEALEVARTVWVVLDEELSQGVPGRDWALDGDGVLEIRAFRGFGRVCEASTNEIVLAYRGRRRPDPARDSLLVLGADGGWTVSAFDRQRAAGPCVLEAGERELELSGVPALPSPPILVRVFERGSYHLADGALRYRRGGGGRQPLTAARLSEASGFEIVDGRVVVHLELDPSSGVGPFTWRLPDEGP